MGNGCGHFFCHDCSCELIRRWRRRSSSHVRCPECRAPLEPSSPFVRPHSYSQTTMSESNIFHWVLRSMTIQRNFGGELFDYLRRRDFTMAFKVCFMLGIVPDQHQEQIAPGWRITYQSMYSYSSCSLCKGTINMTTAFVTRCGHFYCSHCSCCTTFAREVRRATSNAHCHICGTFLRPCGSSFSLLRPSRP